MQHRMDEMLADLANEQAMRTLYEDELDRQARIEEYRALQAELAMEETYQAMLEKVLYRTYQEAEDAYYIREAEAAGYGDYEGFGEVA